MLLALGAAWPVAAQYPERAIRFIVPQAAGSASDNISRIVAPELARQLGQPYDIERDLQPVAIVTTG